MPTACAADLLVPATAGILTRCSSKSMVGSIIFAAQLIRKVEVLDILVQSRRDKKAAKKFFRKLLKGLRYVPRLIITDKLKSYSAAKAEVLPGVEHCQQKYQNNRGENSHQPTRLRERVIRRFKSAGHAPPVGRYLCKASIYRAVMKSRFAAWEDAIGDEQSSTNRSRRWIPIAASYLFFFLS
jgi:hypothetical protein